MKREMLRLKAFVGIVALAACVPPPPGNPDSPGAPKAGDPITGQAGSSSAAPTTAGGAGPTTTKNGTFPPARGPHLCAKGEDVAFACTIDRAYDGRRPLTSVCVSYKTGKPMIVVKEQPEGGKVSSPLEQSSGSDASTLSLIKSGGNPVGFEIRTNRAIYMVLKKGPVDVDGGTLYSGPATYIRMLTAGPIETTPAIEGRCEADQTTAITDNIEAFTKLTTSSD